MADPLPAVWRPVRPDGMACREWGDELVVYNDTTGSTHYLDALGAEVLLALLRSPAGIDTSDLTRDVAARVELDPEIQLHAKIEQALAELEALRLATPSQPPLTFGCRRNLQ